MLFIVEAKNTRNGHTESEGQIREQFGRLTIADANFEIHHLDTDEAHASVSLNRRELEAV